MGRMVRAVAVKPLRASEKTRRLAHTSIANLFSKLQRLTVRHSACAGLAATGPDPAEPQTFPAPRQANAFTGW